MAYMSGDTRITTKHETIALRDLQAKFLEAYATYGTLSRAAKEVGIDRTTAYQWGKYDAVYAALFSQAQLKWADTVRDAVIQRGITGIQTYVVSRGQLVLDANGQPVKLIKYSDALLALLARANIPEYRKLDTDSPSEDTITEYSMVIPDTRRLRQETIDMLLEDVDRMESEDTATSQQRVRMDGTIQEE